MMRHESDIHSIAQHLKNYFTNLDVFLMLNSNMSIIQSTNGTEANSTIRIALSGGIYPKSAKMKTLITQY